MKKRRTPEEIAAARVIEAARTKDFIAKHFGVTNAVEDAEHLAWYWVGPQFHWEKGKRVPELDVPNSVQLYLNIEPPGSKRLRCLGQIVDGVLRTWRHAGNKSHLHLHDVLKCYCIAHYPIAHAAEFGFHSVAVNSDFHLITVEALLRMPQVPKKLQRCFERQIQIREEVK